MKQLGNWFKPQYIIALAIITGAIIIIYKFKDIFNYFGNTGLKENLKVTETTKSNAELKIIADIQESAMGNLGTDTITLFQTLEGLNGQDLKQVFNFFGKRNYAFGMKGGTLIGNTLNLFQWYSAELNEKDLNKMRAIWKTTNLSF